MVTGPYVDVDGIPTVLNIHPQYYPNISPNFEKMETLDAISSWMSIQYLPDIASMPKKPASLNINVASIPEEYQAEPAQAMTTKEDNREDARDSHAVIQRGTIMSTSTATNVVHLRREHLEGLRIERRLEDAANILSELRSLQLVDGEYLLRSNVVSNEEDDDRSTFTMYAKRKLSAPESSSNSSVNLLEELQSYELSEQCDYTSIVPSSIVWSKQSNSVPQVYGTFPPKLLQGRFLPAQEGHHQRVQNRNKRQNSNTVFRGRGLSKKKRCDE